jgi:hypothetical protein
MRRREFTPGLKRAAIMFNPDTAPSALMPSLEIGGPVTQGRANHYARS